MNKDVIYIDVDDDITAIITKVKDAKELVVALVPPKRIGVLQSVVNLRILQRVAKAAHKKIVIISTDQALVALAASAEIPVAKNLQSKPEIPTVAALKVDEGDDIIDGSEVPVAKQKPTKAEKSKTLVATYAPAPKDGDTPKKPKKSAAKVPSFNAFRKKFLIIGGVAVALIAFFVWALVFAPKATVIIQAKTTGETVNSSVALSVNGKTDAGKGVIAVQRKEDKKDLSAEVIATGEKEEGKAASGTMTLSFAEKTTKTRSLPAGTGFSNGDCTFVTQADVEVPGWSPDYSSLEFVPGKVDIQVKATEIGSQCNLSSRVYDSSSDGIRARGSDMSGGEKKKLKIITQADVQKASEKLVQQNSDDVKRSLEAKFGENMIVIDNGFVIDRKEAKVDPGVGQEAKDGKAKLTSQTTYRLYAVDRDEVAKYLDGAFAAKIGKNSGQRVYETGKDNVRIEGFRVDGDGGTVTVIANGAVGPQIKDDEIKERVIGKRYGEIQEDIQGIPGVNDVDIQFWPFWVQSVPDDVKKVTIEFKLLTDE